MKPIEINKNIYWIGVNDRTTDLFEGLWPISEYGVSYNSYLITDQKNVLIDLAKTVTSDCFFNQIEQIIPINQLDYIVINHMEPDHTGLINQLRRLNARAEIILTPKARRMLENYYQIKEAVREVSDGESLTIGNYVLNFYHIPFVHWPETMVTYESTTQTLFSCDAFGGYGALRGTVFADECPDFDFYMKEALRYFVNIVAKFSKAVLNAIDKLKGLKLEIIAPSHGLVFRKNPELIIELYKNWSELAEGGQELGVTLIYGSMYGNTETIMNAVAQGIISEGVNVEIFDAGRTHVSYILASLWTKKGIVIGSPTYEGSLFPPIAEKVRIAILKQIKNRPCAFFGSYGWSKGAFNELKRLTEPAGWQIAKDFEFAGSFNTGTLQKAEAFGRDFAKILKEQS